MLISEVRRLWDKYLPLFLILFCLGTFSSQAQTYSPSTCCTVSNKAYGAAQAVTTDGRSWFYDASNFVMRDYNGTTEVLSYLNLAKYRSGHFPIYVHTGGTLQGNGVWLGGHTLIYWFKDSTDNASLVRWYTDSTGLPGGPFYAVANNLSEGNAGLIKGNLALDNVNNTSDAQKNAASVSLTNHTIDGNLNTLQNISNSALSHSSVGLNITANPASDISVPTTPAALGAGLVANIPDAGASSRGALKAVDWSFFHGKLDSIHVSNDSIYNCVNGTCTLQSVLAGGGAVNSVDGTNTSLLFSPTTGNVRGQVNPAFAFHWTGQHSFLSFAPIFSTLTTAGGLFYGDGFGQLLETGAGTSGQIVKSNGGSAPTFFTPDNTTVSGWLGYTPVSNALGSTHIFVGNGSNIATDVAVSRDISMANTGAATVVGLRGNNLPSPTNGFLKYTSGPGLTWDTSPITQLFAQRSARINGGDTVIIPFRYWDVTAPPFYADSTFTRDATSAIQNAVDSAIAAGGGVVYIPPGHYLVDSLLQLRTGPYYSNCQICVPFVSLRARNAPSVLITGERPPSFESSIFTAGYAPVRYGETILESTIVGSGTLPCVIGVIDSIQGGEHWNATEPTVENLVVRTRTLTVNGSADTVGTMCGINFQNATAAALENVRIDITSDLLNSLMPNNTVGLLMPHADNSAWNYLNRVQSVGYFLGMNLNEHTDADNLFIQAVDTAVQMDNMNHSIHIGKITMQGYVHGFHATALGYINIDNLDVEHLDTSTCVHKGWYGWKDDFVTETTNGLYGNVNYHLVRSCGGSHPEDFKVVNKAATLNPPFFSYSALNQSPLPWQTIIGNGAATTNPIFNQPNSAGLTIASAKGRDPELAFIVNSDSTNQYAAEGVIDAKTQKAPWSSVMSHYIVNGMGQWVDQMWRSNDDANVTTLKRDPYEFNFGVPIYPQLWTTATRQTLGLANGAHGMNSDSSYVMEVLVGPTWFPYATRDWSRSNLGQLAVANSWGAIQNYSTNFGSTYTARSFTDKNYVDSSLRSANFQRAENDLTAQTAAVNVASYTPTNDGTFRIGGYVTITAVSLDVIQLQVTWTDETNTSRTQIFYPLGSTTPGLSVTGANGFPTVDIRVKASTAITVATVLTTGTGSITYDAGASIIQLK